MEEFGIDLSALTIPSSTVAPPPVVPGRIAQIDGDALAYMVAATCEGTSFEECKITFDQALVNRMGMCAADKARVHLTGGNKGNRFDIAVLKEYQGNRAGKVKPKWLAQLRQWMQGRYVGGDILCVMNENQEADDGMAQANYAAIQAGTPHLSIIHADDKDLTMCSGFHCNWRTGEITEVYGYGSIRLDDSGSTKKINGFGTSFFWAQMLTGDTADNIPGLPAIKGRYALRLAPKAVLAADEIVRTGMRAGKPATAAQVDQAMIVVDEFMQKGKPCGPASAFQVLQDCTCDFDALLRVIDLYRAYYLGSSDKRYDAVEVMHWKGHKVLTTVGDLVLEQAQLLWMRRYPGEHVGQFFADIVANKKGWHDATR